MYSEHLKEFEWDILRSFLKDSRSSKPSRNWNIFLDAGIRITVTNHIRGIKIFIKNESEISFLFYFQTSFWKALTRKSQLSLGQNW